MTYFITGGSGYIGKHLVDYLQAGEKKIYILDKLDPNFELGPRTFFVKMDIAQKESVKDLADFFYQSEIGSVLIHLAGKKSVEESFLHPDLYFQSNVAATENLLSAMQGTPVSEIVFASTAAVYGNIDYSTQVQEDVMCQPISPYASSKLKAENLILDSGFRSAILRFFNVAGATRDEFIELTGSNLIPASIRKIESGLPVEIFGDDYATSDGTCIRDYIHIDDLIAAIAKAINVLKERDIGVLNIGSGVGFSVMQILSELSKHSTSAFEIKYLPRRDGDVACVVASIDKARNLLLWHPTVGIDKMVSSSIPKSNRKLSAPQRFNVN